MLAKRSKGKQRRNVKQFPCNPQVPHRCPQVALGSARQFTPIKAAGLPTCLLGPPVVKLPLLLLHSTDTFLRCCTLGQTWSGHPTRGFRGIKERPIVTTRMWKKNAFSNELFIIEIFIKTTPPSLRVKIFNSWRQTQPWYWVPGVRPLHEVNMRNRHSAEGLGAQFQVYSRMTFHDDFAMLLQYLQLLTFQGKQGTALGKESQLLSTKSFSKGVPLSQGCRLWSAWIYSEKVHLLLLSVWRAQLWAYF